MHWIEGINISSCGFSVEVVDECAHHQRTGLVQMHQYIRTPSSGAARRVVTNFADWQRASAQEFLTGYGFAPHVAERHDVFALVHESTRYLIPAAVLAQALFRPFRQVLPFLFQPYGLEKLCVPRPTDLGSVLFWPTSIPSNTRKRATIQEPLSWIWSFPSARRTWESLYNHASHGILGIELPLAQAQLALIGRPAGTAFLVNQIRFHKIQALEPPLEMFAGHPKEISFLGNVLLTRPKVEGTHTYALPRNEWGSWSLLEGEWQKIESVIGPRLSWSRRADFDTREALAGILQRFGEDIAWKECNFGSATLLQAAQWHRRLVRSGKWLSIATILKQTRATPLL